MNWKNIKLIFQREVRDQLRDRRTLFMVAVLPLLLYPALGIGMVQMTVTFAEQTRRVIIVGTDQLPEPSLLTEEGFDPQFFDNVSDIEKLELITDRENGLEPVKNSEELEKLRRFLSEVDERRPRMVRLAEIQSELDQFGEEMRNEDYDRLKYEESLLRKETDSWFVRSTAQVLIVFPENFLEEFRRANEALMSQDPQSEDFVSLPKPIILHNSADERSEIAYQRIRRALRLWESRLLNDRLKAANLPTSLPHPVPLTSVDLAEPEQIAANVWSKIFPALLVIMSVTGAFYPAIDLGAGEKERGTMETLLISPATRTEIVFGKFLTVMLFSFLSALLNLASMGMTGQHVLSSVGAARSNPLGDLSFPPLESMMWVVLLAIPLAALFSALSLSLAMFARSSKEGQYYLTPLLLVTMGLTVFCLNPGVELTPYYSVLPVTGPALLLKALLLGGASSTSTIMYAVPVLLTSCAYSMLALWWAIDQFQREDILFREAERFDLRTWFQHLLREKESTPSFMQAFACFAVIAFLQFLFFVRAQSFAELMQDPQFMVVAQLVILVVTIGVPPVLMAILLTSKARQTLKLTWPRWEFIAVAILLGITVRPLAVTLLGWLAPFFPDPPEGMKALSHAIREVPVWLTLAAFAVTPAVCEELAFRGYILSGLQRSRRVWLPVVLSSVMFGVIHMIPHLQFNATLLGLLMACLAIRSGSLVPCMLFHGLFNAGEVLMAQIPEEAYSTTALRWFVTLEKVQETASLHYTPVTLAVCGAISAVILFWLISPLRASKRLKENGSASLDSMNSGRPETVSH